MIAFTRPPDTAEHDLDPGILKIHDQVPRGLGNPGRNRRSRAQDPDPPTGMLDDRQHVQAGAGLK